MMLKYRAYIDGEFYYFDLKWLANIHMYLTQRLITNGGNCECIMEPSYIPCKECMKVSNVIEWLHAGNQPDVFTGYRDKYLNDIYSNDKIKYGTTFQDGNPVYFDDGIVFFDEIFGCFRVKNEYYDKTFNRSDYDDQFDLTLLMYWVDSCEIIGTTHQNKDLLK